jgi:hypothetical protein
LEGVTSSGEVLEGSVVFRVLNEGPVEIGNPFGELVPEVEGAQIEAISAGAVSIKVTVSLVSEMEKKYSGTMLRFKGHIPVRLNNTYINTHESSFIPSNSDEAGHIISSDFPL